MGTLTFNIISGHPPFIAVLTPPIGAPYILTGLSSGINMFTGIPEGDDYTLTIADSRGCTWVIEDIDFHYLSCSETGIFQYAHSSIVVNDVMFLGERKLNPNIIRFPDPDDLSVYTTQTIPGVGSSGQGLESVCYSSSTGKLYFGARDNGTGNLAIIEVDPDDISIYTEHVINIPADLFVITTDGTYIYGGTDEVFFKITISDWSYTTQNFLASGFADSHGAAISVDRGLFYVSSQYSVSKLAIVSMADISSYTIVDLSAHVSHPTDDICVYDDGDVCKVYVAGEWSYLNNGAASVEITNGNAVEGIELLPSYGTWEHCGIIYSAAISNRIQSFNINDPSAITTVYIEAGFIPNELLIVNNRMFATHWGGLGSAKLCEVYCVDVVCNTTTTTSSTSSTTTTTTTSSSSTTTTTSSSSTTTTTTTCYQLYGCGIYDIYNPTSEFKQVSWKYCYEESWRGIITLPPHTTYSPLECRAFEAEGCDLIFTLSEECIPTTTTTSTTKDCSMEGYIICDYTTTTTTTVCSLPSGWTEEGVLITNGDFGGNFSVDFTSNLDDATEAWINFMCNSGSLYGGIDINGKWWGPHDNFRVYDDVYIRDTCQLVDSGYYILNSTDHYYQIVQIDNGNITTYWSVQCPTTTTTTTICPCNDEEILVSDSETFGVANTFGTYCSLSDEKYNSQIFTLPGNAYIKRIGVLGWDKVGNPDVTIQGLLLTKKSPDYAGRPGCTTVTAAPYPGFDIEASTNTIRFTGTPPANPEWYYFCFDNVYLEAGQWAFAMIFTDQTVNDGSNYVQFCTGGDDYAGGNYAYKISPEKDDPYGIPEISIDLSCRICYELEI